MTKEEIKEKANNFINDERLDEKSKRTIVDYINDVKKLIDFLPEDFILNKQLMLDFKDYLDSKGYSVSSKNKYVVVINKFMRYLGHDECILKKYKKQEKSSIDDPIWEQEHKRGC
jgi:site-specific recombinase XerD